VRGTTAGDGIEAFAALPSHEPASADAIVSEERGRWNEPGSPTLYLASDVAAAIAEAARHLERVGQVRVGGGRDQDVPGTS
jgi:hypothetical protein